MSRLRIHISRIVLSVVCVVVLLLNIFFLLENKALDSKLFEEPTDLPVSFCATMDNLAPEITLNGDASSMLLIGQEPYKELGASVVDDCDVVELEITGTIDNTKAGVYTVIYSSEDKSGNLATVTRTINVVPEYRGTVYLTFDDGPSIYTAELLDVLKRYNVKATFFVTGGGDDNLILREYQEGHTVGLHTFTHDYAYIYQSIDAFFEDLYRVQERIKSITGYTSFLMRFPGGSSNTISRYYDGGAHIMSQLASEVEKRGFTYFDWNVSSGDAGATTSSEQVFANVVYALKEGGSSVILQHDIKGFSVAAVEQIIQYCLANGYQFAALDASSFTAHHGINN